MPFWNQSTYNLPDLFLVVFQQPCLEMRRDLIHKRLPSLNPDYLFDTMIYILSIANHYCFIIFSSNLHITVLVILVYDAEDFAYYRSLIGVWCSSISMFLEAWRVSFGIGIIMVDWVLQNIFENPDRNTIRSFCSWSNLY